MKRQYKAIAQYYDAEHEAHEYLREDVPLFMSHLSPGERVLELGVGTGRVAIPLAMSGYHVTGLDRDSDMLAICQHKADEAGIGNKRLTLVQGDMAAFTLKRKFDCVAVLFNTFLSLTLPGQQHGCLASAAKHLKRGGKLWLDMVSPNIVLMAEGTTRGLDARLIYVAELKRTVMCSLDIRPGSTSQVQRVTHRYEWFNERGKRERAKVDFEMTSIFPRELALLLGQHGFDIEKFHGDYDGSDIGTDSPRQIVLARKRSG